MDAFEKKYGINEDEDVKKFHRSRRMFCIIDNELHIAEPDLPYSHATWFEEEGWITADDDNLINEIVRGIVDGKGDVYFYTGYDFDINDQIESEFFPHLKNLVDILKIKENNKIFGGLIKSKPGTIWPARKDYGTIKNNL